MHCSADNGETQLGVGFRLPELLGNRDEQERDIIWHVSIGACDPHSTVHATFSGVIEAICSPAMSSARSSS